MITIVGGSGFLGSKLIETLGPTNCKNLDKNPSPYYNGQTTIGNIQDKEQIVLSNKKTDERDSEVYNIYTYIYI